MINNAIKIRLESFFSEDVVSDRSISGGCIADSRILKLRSGKSFFLKQGFSNDMFKKEANSLNELAKTNTIRIPQVIIAEDNFLLIENIESGKKTNDFYEVFGRQFAQLHKFSSGSFGFYEDNYIGASPQYNISDGDQKNNWTSFYLNKRLLPQFQMALSNGYTDEEFNRLFDKLCIKLDDILKDSHESPSLLHGDLWSGNYMVDSNGEPVIFDPAVYYGHREADLAMTKLFGGFPPSFYAAYNEAHPLPAGDGYRFPLYMLYHVLNHLNLFGTGYYDQALAIMRRYVG